MRVNILGTRGIPAAHGGFETFAERLALYLAERGHEVLVYCQPETGPSGVWAKDNWRGILRRSYRSSRNGPIGTMEFDWACVRDVVKQPGVDLVLGYNTAVFNTLQRLRGRRVYLNMDGIEWKRAKWSRPAKLWFFLNEIIGANISTVPIADHPEIVRHVSKRCTNKPVMIPYGADKIAAADPKLLSRFGLEADQYLISIARAEPENSILQMVRAFSSLQTNLKCVVLGRFDADNAYHREVKQAAGPNVVFPGPIYDSQTVASLRYHARAYLHGHRVGGTNPSLVEALGAGNAVIAHDNPFNRWVTGSQQLYFTTQSELRAAVETVSSNRDALSGLRRAARMRHEEEFQWPEILAAYENLLLSAP